MLAPAVFGSLGVAENGRHINEVDQIRLSSRQVEAVQAVGVVEQRDLDAPNRMNFRHPGGGGVGRSAVFDVNGVVGRDRGRYPGCAMVEAVVGRERTPVVAGVSDGQERSRGVS